MNKTYPFTSAQILTDDVYTQYGGVTGTSTQAQRNAAYYIAEEWASLHVGSPVAPAIITGTYFYPQVGRTVQLDWMYLQSIHEIRFLDSKGTNYYTITGVDNYHAAVRNQERSVLDILTIVGNCQGCGGLVAPYQFQIVYEAGLPTGTSTSPSFLLGLTEAAKITVNEILGYGNEGVGGVGISEFANQEYREKRTALTNTVFGSSAKAQFILKLLGSARRRKGLGL